MGSRLTSAPFTNASLFSYQNKDGEVQARALEVVFAADRGALTQFSILRDLEKAKQALQSRIANKELSLKEDKALGCFLGMPIGDSIGAPVEFKPVRTTGEPLIKDMGTGTQGAFHLQPGQWTDDSSMGLALADSLLSRAEFDPTDLMLRFVSWWHAGYNNAFAQDKTRQHSVGLGGNIHMSFDVFLTTGVPYTTAGDRKTSGNGSIMRLAAVPVAYHDDEAMALDVASRQSKTTHQGDEAAELCRLMAFIIVRAINAKDSSKAFLDTLGQDFTTPLASVRHLASSQQEGEDPDRNWNWKASEYPLSMKRVRENAGYYGSYAMDGMCMALHCLYHSADFASAVLKCANMCGDADSTSSVCGQMAGAIYGLSSIPADWIATVQKWDRQGEIALRASMLFHHSKDLVLDPVSPSS